MNSIVFAAFQAILQKRDAHPDDFVFPSSKKAGEPLQGTRGWFPRAMKEAGVLNYTYLCNRHTTASRLVMAGVDLRTVAEILGHRTIQMTMRYSHLAPQHQASALDRLVPVPAVERTPERTPVVFETDAQMETSL
jgi:site-specific recombinase XerD